MWTESGGLESWQVSILTSGQLVQMKKDDLGVNAIQLEMSLVIQMSAACFLPHLQATKPKYLLKLSASNPMNCSRSYAPLQTSLKLYQMWGSYSAASPLEKVSLEFGGTGLLNGLFFIDPGEN